MTVHLTPEDFTNPVGFQVAYLNQKPHKKQIEVLLSPNKNKIVVIDKVLEILFELYPSNNNPIGERNFLLFFSWFCLSFDSLTP